jgi:hypothetical protein
MDRPEYYSITWDDAFLHGSLRNDNSWFKVYHQCEPPEVLDVISRLIDLQGYYDLILAWDDRVLNSCPNAKFLTESCCSWMDRRVGGDIRPLLHNFEGTGMYPLSPVVSNYSGCDVAAKRFAVSFLTSSKGSAPGHILRQEIFNRLQPLDNIEIWKHRSPPRVDDKRTVLEPYMFSICPENSRHNGYYSEKIVDCFVAKTIPVYWGCKDIGKHFNLDGVIQFENYDDLVTKLQSLTPEFYHDREPAIEENFRRALQGVHQWTLIENYITDGINKKHATGRAY